MVNEKQIEHKIENINYELVSFKLELGKRYNYYALDLYYKKPRSLRETLITGSKNKVMIYLLGLEKRSELKSYVIGGKTIGK